MQTSMTLLAAACIGGAGAGACAVAAVAAPPASTAKYETQLFNLLSDKPGIIDRKNHHDAGFDAGFDQLLASSRLAKVDKNKVALKKRLLSGPAAEGKPLDVPGSPGQWIYYTACQAHRCDEVSLGLLFEPASGRMVGKLHLDGQFEHLGAPSEAEKRVLDQKIPEDRS
jgi:hypothetical protein